MPKKKHKSDPVSDALKEIGEGFVSGGIVGYVTDVAIGALFQTFQEIVPIFGVLGPVYAIVSFLWGIEQGILAGAFFSLGIIMAGALLQDSATVASGCISIIGVVVSAVWKETEKND
jgi:hypothetical protein